MDKFYNHADVPWVHLTWEKLYQNKNTPPHARNPIGSFWWKQIIKLHTEFISLASCKPKCGVSVLFWSDKWSDYCLKDKYPRLYSFAKKEKLFHLVLPDIRNQQLSP